MRRSSIAFLFAALVSRPLSAPAAAGDPAAECARWVPLRLLEGLGPNVAGARRPQVEKALEEFPGCVETLLLALMSLSAQEKLWASPGLAFFGPGAPGILDTVVPGRTAGWNLAPGPSPELQAASATGSGRGWVPLGNKYVSPLLLDLDGDGKPGVEGGDWKPHPGTNLGTARLVAFDIDGDGYEDLTEWLTGQDGLLVDPESPDKVVPVANGFAWSGRVSGKDLVGTAGGWRSGFQKLAYRDANSDGAISGDELLGLYVWVDGDHDAAVGLGELRELAAFGVTSLELPRAGEEIGRFVARGKPGFLWDWWPSYALVKEKPASSLQSPGTVVLERRALPPDMLPFLWILPCEPGVRGSKRAKKETMDMVDWETLRIVALAPDGSRLLLRDREPDSAAIAGGLGVRLWVLWMVEEGIAVKKVSLPFGDIHQAVFESPDRALIVGDSGAKLAAVEFPSLDRALLEPGDPAKGPAFRCGSIAVSAGGFALFSDGYFTGDWNRDGIRETTPNLLLRYEGPRLDEAPRLVAVGDTDRIRADVASLGDIAAELPVSPDLFFFAVREHNANYLSLAAWKGGAVSILDRRVRPGALAADGTRVLYVREGKSGEPDAGEAMVYDVANGETFFLARGDFTYPYLAARGGYAFLTSIDWVAGTMTFLGAPVAHGSTVKELLTIEGIGAIRVSADGNTFACLAPDGLHIGQLLELLVAGLFLRGNADGSALPPNDPRAAIDITDGIYLLNYLFAGGPAPPCLDAADANDDGSLDISDAIRILSHLFLGGEEFGRLPSPWPFPGADRTEDGLGCGVPQAGA